MGILNTVSKAIRAERSLLIRASKYEIKLLAREERGI